MRRRMLSSVMAVCIVMGSTAGLANEMTQAGGTGSSKTTIEQIQTNFSVTLPVNLPIDVDRDGVITTADNVEMVNNSFGPVEVKEINVSTNLGWGLGEYGKDYGKEKIGLKEIGLNLNDDNVNINGSVALESSKWAVMGGKERLPLTYDATLGVQRDRVDGSNVANVEIVVGWYTIDGIVDESDVNNEQDKNYSGTKDGEFRYIGTDKVVEIPHVIKGVPVTSYQSMFHGSDVTKVVSTNKNIKSIRWMFQDSTSETLDLSELDTSSVTDMRAVFPRSKAVNLDLSSFDTSKVTDMGGMFYYNEAKTIDLSSFDTSKVTIMNGMFHGTQVTSLDLSSFDTSEVTDMKVMFRDSKVKNVDVTSFNTSKVRDMAFMFYQIQATSLDLSSFDMGNEIKTDYMFTGTPVKEVFARTEADANKLKASSSKPAGLNFIVR